MKQRIITGTMIALFVLLVLMSNEYIMGAVISLVTIFALAEFLYALKKDKTKVAFSLSLVFSVLGILALLFYTKAIFLVLFLYIISMLSLGVIFFESVNIKDIALMFFMTLFLIFTMFHIILLRLMEHGGLLVFFVFIGAFATDTCAYFAGSFFGKKKLCPNISPKKTVEGAVGGVLGCVVLMLLYAFVLNKYFSLDVNYIRVIILSVLVAVFSQFGDLSASVVKRQVGIKDFGKILPGHGGIMDRLDSITFVAPLVYYFMSFFPFI